MTTRGGKREGAGRKPRSEPREALTLRVEIATAEKFKRICKSTDRSQSEQFTEMVKRAKLPANAEVRDAHPATNSNET
jgi:hypothetical protein